MDLQPFKDAELGPTDISRLLKTSRVTVSLWLNDHTEPHPYIRPKLTKLLDAVSRSVKAGELPVPEQVDRRERQQYIARVIAEQLRKAA